MCRERGPEWRRCLKHSKEGRAFARALERMFQVLALVAVKLDASLATAEGCEGALLSGWRLALRKVMRTAAVAGARLAEKRERFNALREKRNAERLAKLPAERQEKASQALEKQWAAISRMHKAESRHQDAGLLVTMDSAIKRLQAAERQHQETQAAVERDEQAADFMTDREIRERVVEDALHEYKLAMDNRIELENEIRPEDREPRLSGPKKGLPGPTMLAFNSAAHTEQFWKKTYELLLESMEAMTTPEENRAALAESQGELEAARQAVEDADREANAALAPGAPRGPHKPKRAVADELAEELIAA